MASLRDGEGSHYYILFHFDENNIHCMGKIFDKTHLISQDFKKEIEKINFLDIFLNEVAFENDVATLYFYFDRQINAWQSLPMQDNISFLGIFRQKEKGYLPWSKWYYDISLDKTVIKDIFDFKPLTQDMVAKLNKELELQDIMEDIQEIGYPYEIGD